MMWRTRRDRWPHLSTSLLWMLLLATLLMPVDYRAGTTATHTHTIYQSLIDAVSGHSHHPTDAASHTPEEHAVSPFADLTIPLAASAAAGEPLAEPGLPDEPVILGLATPILAATAILGLGLLVAMLLDGSALAGEWAASRRLTNWIPGAISPPPRVA